MDKKRNKGLNSIQVNCQQCQLQKRKKGDGDEIVNTKACKVSKFDDLYVDSELSEAVAAMKVGSSSYKLAPAQPPDVQGLEELLTNM